MISWSSSVNRMGKGVDEGMRQRIPRLYDNPGRGRCRTAVARNRSRS
jgi:hypothetical protein